MITKVKYVFFIDDGNVNYIIFMEVWRKIPDSQIPDIYKTK